MVPEVGLIKPAAIFSNVVFPHPEGPRTVKSSPFLIVNLNLSMHELFLPLEI